MIQDSNGNIIWGSQSAFPYRRLEYIDMYGKYYNTYNRPAKGYYYLDFKLDPNDPIDTNLGTYGIYLGSAGPLKRLFFGGKPSEIFQRLKNNADTTVKSYNDLNSNDKYCFGLRTYNTNNTAGQWWYMLVNQTTNTQLYGQYYGNTTYAMNLSELPYMYINAYAYNTSGTSAAPQAVATKGALKFKLYRFYVKEDDSSSNIKWDYYPVQRKSDNAVGLYNVKTGSFTHMFNTDGTGVYTITEPVADEYWDLTAPA